MKTLNFLFKDCVEKYNDRPFLQEKIKDKYVSLSFNETQTRAYDFAAGLLALGIEKGDRISLLSEGRNNWVIAELGIFHAGAVNVPLSVKLAEPEEIRFRVEHSGSRMVIVSKNQVKKVRAVVSELKSLEKIILFDNIEKSSENEITFDEVVSLGQAYLKENFSKFEERWKSIQESDFANICYTSGTTADPKGIILTHRNYTANIEQSLSLFHIPETWVTLLILPWDHAFAHSCGIYTLMSCGASLAAIKVGDSPMETLKNIPINIKETKPDFLMSVPALSKNFKKNIEKGISDKGKVVEWLFNTGLKIGYTYNGNGWNKGKGLKPLIKPFYSLFDSIIFKKVREGFGGNLKYYIGGGALLDIELQRFFAAIGIPIYQGYGLTEAAPVISANNPNGFKMGSSGKIVKYLELKICDDKGNSLPVGEKGEIVVRGENVMAGYWKNDEATAETIKNGWLYTGDMGYVDTDGFLFVLGRFKSLLIADDGEKFSPEGIEEAFVANSPIIEQCMLYNNQNPYTVCLVYPNKEALKRYAIAQKIDFSTDDGIKQLLKHIESEINQYRAGEKFSSLFPQRWLPSSIAILQEGFTEDNQLLNSTLKMVRGKIIASNKNSIDYLYTPESKNIQNSRNIVALKNIFKL